MHRIPKILLSVTLIAAVCFACFSCDSTPASAEDTNPAAESTESLPAYDTVLSMICQYTVVRPDASGGSSAKDAMSLILDALGKNAKSPATDWVNERAGETPPANNNEILIGETNRASSAAATEALKTARPNHAKDFSITFFDGEVVIAGGSEEILPTAAQYFIDNILETPTADYAFGESIVVLYDYPFTTVCGLDPASLSIRIPDAALQTYAQTLQAGLFDTTGYQMPIIESAEDSAGSTISISVDTALDLKSYQIQKEGETIIMKAGHNQTLSSAVDALLDGAAQDGSVYEGRYTGTTPLTAGDFVLNTYRTAIADALSAAGKAFAITANGSDTGFDAIVDSDMEKNAYTVTVTDTGISVRAGHYLALEAALQEVLSGKGLDGTSFSGTYAGDVPLNYNDMTLVWNDEFNTETLDTEKWTLKAKMSQSDIHNGTDDHNVTIEDGKLLMRSWKEEDSEVPYSTNTSVTTDGTMSYRYGYLEMYANVPFMRGAWPSFWMQSKDTHRTVGYMTEVDIFEVFGSNNSLAAQLHKWDFNTGEHVQLPVSGRDYVFDGDASAALNDEYHLYGFGWTPTEMYFTVDGEVFFSYDITEAGNFGFDTMQGFQDPLFIIFNNFLFTEGSSWLPTGADVTADTVFPIEYRIEWIRLYQKPGEGDIFYDAYN